MYIIACRAYFCHLLGLGQVGHSPRGTSGSAGTLDCGPMWSGSQSICHPKYTPNTPDAPGTPKMPPDNPRSHQCPLIPLYPSGPWVHSPCQPLIHPWHPLYHWCPLTSPKWPLHSRSLPMPLNAPILLLALSIYSSCQPPQYTPDTPYTPWQPIMAHNIPTPQVFNCYHFTTDHLQEYVQFKIYHL